MTIHSKFITNTVPEIELVSNRYIIFGGHKSFNAIFVGTYMKRRTFASYSAVVVTAGLSGCVDDVTQLGSDGATETESRDSEADGRESQSDEAGSPESQDDGAEGADSQNDGADGLASQSDGGEGPESLVVEYLEAVATGDEETVAALRHDSLDIPPETYEVQEFRYILSNNDPLRR